MNAIAVKNEKTGSEKFARFKRWIPVYIMMLPGMLYLLFNNYLPISGLVVAFEQYNVKGGIWFSPWVGLKNFTYLFTSKDALVFTRNTILYNLVFIALNTVVGVITAILITEVKSHSAKKVYQSAVLLPFLVSMVIVSYMVYAALSVDTGMMNKQIIPALGMESVNWYSESKYWPFILTLVNTWKNIGFGTIIYIGAISGIDQSLYEAAAVDGATRLKQIFSITLPNILPQIITMILLSVGKIFYSDFGLFYQIPMDSGLLYDVTTTIDTYVYRSLLKIGNIGMSSAACVYQSIVGFVFVLVVNLVVKKLSPENSML